MFKKITTVAVLSSAIIFGGASLHSADAAAKDQTVAKPYKVYYSTNINWGKVNHKTDVNNFLQNYFSMAQHNENAGNHVQDKPVKQPVKQPEKQPEKKPVKQPEKQPTKQPTTNNTQNQNQSNSSNLPSLSKYEQQVVDLTNQERSKQGLKPLKADLELSRVAREKSHDMAVNGYFSHNSPTYGSPFDMMKSWGINYNTAGENIAKGQQTPQEVVNAWMNSQGHRENIMNPNFTKIGVGYSSQGNIWTQQFIG